MSVAIDNWVRNHQKHLTGSELANLTALSHLTAAIGGGYGSLGSLGIQALSKGEVQHPTPTRARVTIPASGWTNGGEMLITAYSVESAPAGPWGTRTAITRIEIDGKTQGLVGSALRENVYGVRDYLTHALPECEHKNLVTSEETAQPVAGIASDIERLSALYEKGLLTEPEFIAAKRKLLS